MKAPNKNTRWSRTEVKILEQMIREGRTTGEIAEYLGRTRKGIEVKASKIRHRYPAKKLPPNNTGRPQPVQSRSLDVVSFGYGFAIGAIVVASAVSASYLVSLL